MNERCKRNLNGRFARHEWTEFHPRKDGKYYRHCTRCKIEQSITSLQKVWGEYAFISAKMDICFKKLLNPKAGKIVRFRRVG